MPRPIPPIPEPLMEWLEETFPDKIPEEGCALEAFYLRQGEQRVMRKLRVEFNRKSAIHQE